MNIFGMKPQRLLDISKMIAMTYSGKYGKYNMGMEQHWYDIDAVQWYTCQDDNNFYICIQGSRSKQDNNQDWKDNLDCDQVFIKNSFDEGVHGNIKKDEYINSLLKKIEVHDGHNGQTKILFETMYDVLKETNKNIVICGHSLGGGLAQMLPVYIGYIFGKYTHVDATEGAPRSGNQAFVDAFHYFTRHNIRIVDRDDPVVKLPFRRTLFWKYRHVRNKLIIGKKRGWKRFLPWNYYKWIKKEDVDHNPKDYVENLEKYINDNCLRRCLKKNIDINIKDCKICFKNGKSGYAKYDLCKRRNLI